MELAKRSFQQQFAYRAATLAGLFTNSVFGVMLASIYLGLFRSGPPGKEVQGFTAQTTVTYVWIGQALIMPVFLWGYGEIIATIQSGQVVTDMLKPTDYFAYWYSRDMGRALAHIIRRGIPTLMIGSILFDLVYPDGPARWIAFAVSVLMAVTVSFAFRFMTNLWGFWLLDQRGIGGITVLLVGVLSGHLLPIAWYPDPIANVINLLPFRAIIMSPVQIWLGQVSILSGLGLQAFWCAVMIALAYGVQSLAEKKVVVQGG